MSDVKWIKIATDIFNDEKILLIESMPSADSIIVIWFKLLCLAGKMNNSGVFVMNNLVACTDKMLATIFRTKYSTVQRALQTFENLGMIEIVDGVITIPNWAKHQNLDQLKNRKEYMQDYMQKYRDKQKLLASCKPNGKVNSKVNGKVNVNSPEEDKEKESDIRERKNTSSSTFSGDVQCVIDAWNAIGARKITKIVDGTDRHAWLKTRIRDYGLDSVLKAIENVKNSDFLMGRTKDGFNITFDWFIRPNNFPKVLDGNYTTVRKEETHGNDQGSAGQPQRIGHYI